MTPRRLVAALLLGVIVTAGGLWWWLWSDLYGCRSTSDIELIVEPGMAGREVLSLLQREQLLPSPLAGRLYLRFAADGRSLRFGHYRIAAGARPADVLEQLLAGEVIQISVTVVEGSDLAALAAQMAAAGIGDEAAWIEAAGRLELIADLMPAATSLEGFFFPDTYQFAKGIGVEAAARHLVERFRQVWSQERARVTETWGDPFEVIIMASLVEAETAVDDERARVAGVFVNRLERGMLLQCDPTVVYSLKRRGEWTGRLLRIHWGVDDPYNTYRYPGLPPGPINSPGRAAIQAALNPEEHDFLYFVASPAGGHTFSRTLAEHNRAVAVWTRSRR
jgi:UPF0755 protein